MSQKAFDLLINNIKIPYLTTVVTNVPYLNLVGIYITVINVCG